MKYFKLWALIIIFSLGLHSCSDPSNLGLVNPKFSKYTKAEIQKASILAISAKLEKDYHAQKIDRDHDESNSTILDERSQQIDFLRRIKENE